MLESPQSFVTRQECDKVTYQNGFRRPHGEIDGWQRYSSTTAQGSIWLARDTSGVWFLALDHAGVIAEIEVEASEVQGPGLARFRFASLAQLYGVMPRVYELAASLPDAPLKEFLLKTHALPKSTEAERVVVQRVGQEIFRSQLLTYWQHTCPLTGISDSSLLRASHIKPWRDCPTDAERLDVHNGLLLSALWDAAFDNGLVSFDLCGAPIFSPQLSTQATANLQESMRTGNLILTPEHHIQMAWHRNNIFSS
ncbi:MAG: HNH endonuclease [Rhodobacteraceae bacterium]|nr:MAG: HNH endonuclease [Paracoccaceae bacterium]